VNAIGVWSTNCGAEIIPRAEAFASAGGPRYLAISARFLADFMAYAEGWAAQLEAQLEAEQ
jgi:hypothetical protein